MQGIRWIERRNKELTKVREVSGTILTGMLFFVSRFGVSQNKNISKVVNINKARWEETDQ